MAVVSWAKGFGILWRGGTGDVRELRPEERKRCRLPRCYPENDYLSLFGIVVVRSRRMGNQIRQSPTSGCFAWRIQGAAEGLIAAPLAGCASNSPY
jgi:hypothetical protein